MIRSITLLLAWFCLSWFPPRASGEPPQGFPEVLALAELAPDDWPETFVEEVDRQPTIGNPAWQLCQQLLYRLRQFPEEQVQAWAVDEEKGIERGSLLRTSGTITAVSQLKPPPGVVEPSTLYLCTYRDESRGEQGQVFVPKIPSRWQSRTSVQEPVEFVGLLLNRREKNGEKLLLTKHVEWYPTQGVESGLLLLSQQGMDVSLLDEVRHRQPFVKANESREGEAFYTSLAALAGIETQALAVLTLENIKQIAREWTASAEKNRERLATLRQELKTSDSGSERKTLQEKITETRKSLAIAAAVNKQADRQVSSVAPLFLQPEEQTGQLVRIEGVARRAVRIAADELENGAYFELEVFTSDSQNLPVVCCVATLPKGFPQGDQIRESVRVDGIFFKSWRYRTRRNIQPPGQTARQQQLYTPVVVGPQPVWLRSAADASPAWVVVGGLGVLLAFGMLWYSMIRSSRRVERDDYSLNLTQLEQQLRSDPSKSSP